LAGLFFGGEEFCFVGVSGFLVESANSVGVDMHFAGNFAGMEGLRNLLKIKANTDYTKGADQEQAKTGTTAKAGPPPAAKDDKLIAAAER
jgi:hypothetical protein